MPDSEYEDLIKAISNEVVVEEYFYKINGLSPQRCGFVPRINSLKNLLARNYVVCGITILRLLWVPIFSIMYNLLFLSRIVIKKVNIIFYGQKKSDMNKVFFCSGKLSYERMLCTIGDCELSIILRPLDNKLDYNNDSTINVLELISFSTMLSTFIKSIYITAKMRRSEYSSWILQSYVVFEWLLVYRALSKIDANLFFSTDHFDRWAVLVDCIVDRKKIENSASFTIIQHGILCASNEVVLPFELCYKLKNVDVIYAFDEKSKKIFSNSILQRRCTPPSYILIEPKIELEETCNNKINVLFVGHSACLDFQVSILNKLKLSASCLDVAFIYKPHPTQRHLNSLNDFPWDVYMNKDKFPNVDIVITYPSTLGYEYSLLRKTIFEHPIDAVLEDEIILLSSINNELLRIQTI